MNSTIEYYNSNSNQFIEDTIGLDMSNLYKQFEIYLSPGNKILDLGCGSGRDSRHFEMRGYDVIAVDPSEKMCESARNIADVPVFQMRAEDLNFQNEFDGIWACASFIHIEREKLHNVITRIVDCAVDGGVVYVSWKYGNNEIVHNGKYLCYMTEKSLNRIFAEVRNIVLIDMWISDDTQGRNEKWINVLLKRCIC